MSIHIAAKPGDIAEAVLLPGDPLRAKWIAETYLKDPVCYNEVRGMFGFTGTYNGVRVSVQGSGMGIPSTLIYCNELIKYYGAKKLIRVGTAGSYQEDVRIGDIVIAMSASTTSGINNTRFDNADYSPTANFELFEKAVAYARENAIDIKAGNILSADEFYEDNHGYYRMWAEYGVLCVEMETSGLYTVAAKNNVKALTVLTISDSLVTGEQIAAEDRERELRKMVEIALAAI